MRHMRHMTIAIVAAAALAGCGENWLTIDGKVDETEAQKISAAIEMIEGQRAAWNKAGYDPLKVSAPVLSLASMGCGSLAMAGALADPSIGQTTLKICNVVLNIAGPASAAVSDAPVAAPMPDEKPAS